MATYKVIYIGGAKSIEITCDGYHIMPVDDGGNGSKKYPEVLFYNGTPPDVDIVAQFFVFALSGIITL